MQGEALQTAGTRRLQKKLQEQVGAGCRWEAAPTWSVDAANPAGGGAGDHGDMAGVRCSLGGRSLWR